MKPYQAYYIRVPASIGNMGPGFDALGLALKLYLHVWVKPAEQPSISFIGLDADRLDARTNRISLAFRASLERWGVGVPPLSVEVHNEIPVERGLGGSGAATLAGIAMAAAVTGHPCDADEFLQIATSFESHVDNVAASLLGGFVAGWQDSQGRWSAYPARVPRSLRILVLWPHEPVRTDVMRTVLPDVYPREVTVRQFQRIAALLAYWSRNKGLPPPDVFDDEAHQPYRLQHLPHSARILEIARLLRIPGVLSGSGPTVALFADESRRFLSLLERLQEEPEFASWRMRCLRPDRFGCVVRTVDTRHYRRPIPEPHPGYSLSGPLDVNLLNLC